MAETEQRKCENCGKLFTPKAYWQKWCSNRCKTAAMRKRKKEAEKQPS